jgi:hypothetical protein
MNSLIIRIKVFFSFFFKSIKSINYPLPPLPLPPPDRPPPPPDELLLGEEKLLLFLGSEVVFLGVTGLTSGELVLGFVALGAVFICCTDLGF